MNDVAKGYTIEELEKILGVEKKRIGEAMEGDMDLLEHVFFDPELPEEGLYRQGDSTMYLTEEGAKIVAQKVGVDPGLVAKS